MSQNFSDQTETDPAGTTTTFKECRDGEQRYSLTLDGEDFYEDDAMNQVCLTAVHPDAPPALAGDTETPMDVIKANSDIVSLAAIVVSVGFVSIRHLLRDQSR